MKSLHMQNMNTVELLLLSSVQPLPATLKFWVPERLPNSPVAPRLMLRLVDMRLQLAYSANINLQDASMLCLLQTCS